MNWTYNTPKESGVYFYKESYFYKYSIFYVDVEYNEMHAFLNKRPLSIPGRIVDSWLGPITPELVTSLPQRIKFVLGEIPDFFSESFIRKMIDKINERLSDGLKFNID